MSPAEKGRSQVAGVVQRAASSVVAIVGPTGAGKTDLALSLARQIDAEIVNADSRQIYRGLDIGSAKPTARERAVVPHHLFDVADPDEVFDCARYRALARQAIDAIRLRGRRVLLVGGTGLYLKALRHGLMAGPPREPQLRQRLEALEEAEPGALHARVAHVDPAAADRLHPHDLVRLIRAVEVYELTGTPISVWQREHGFRTVEVPVRMIGLTLERTALYDRINQRCATMVEAGLVEEVRELQRRGYGPETPALGSIGYREIAAFLAGRCDLARAVADMAQATRHFAKRQMTWFRRDPTVSWYDTTRTDVTDLIAELRV